MKIGELSLTAVNDGEFITGPEYFGPLATFEGHEDLVGPDGKMHMPIGCFVVQGGPLGEETVLVDAGLGEMSGDTFIGGKLMGELAGAGVRPETVGTIVCSHLHIDHCGWLVDGDGKATFPNAALFVGEGDWTRFVVEGTDLMLPQVRDGLRRLLDDGRVTLIEGDAPIAPGVTALAAPGHTPGHLVIVLSEGLERAILLGDAISCPVQLDETEWGAISDVDPALARRTRERMWAELERSGDPGVGAHFPDLKFGRVLVGEAGRRWRS